MITYKIWVPEFESVEDARTYEAHSVRDAAADAARSEFERNGDFDVLDFLVLEESTGTVFEVGVECENEPTFYVTSLEKAQHLLNDVTDAVIVENAVTTEDDDATS